MIIKINIRYFLGTFFDFINLCLNISCTKPLLWLFITKKKGVGNKKSKYVVIKKIIINKEENTLVYLLIICQDYRINIC